MCGKIEKKTRNRSSLNHSQSSISHGWFYLGTEESGCDVNFFAQTVYWLKCWCSGPIGGFVHSWWLWWKWRGRAEGGNFPTLTVMYAISAEQEPFHFRDAPCLNSSAQPKRIRWMLLHPAVPWISNSLVQLQSKRQDQETPKGCAVTAEQRDEVSMDGSGPQKTEGWIKC